VPRAAGDQPDRLEALELHVHFEGLRATDGVDLTLERGEILGLIGPNGAGKTTLVNALSGFQRLTGGEVRLGGRTVTGWAPHRLARNGVVRTFQSVRPFTDLTVLENIEASALGGGLGRRDARTRSREIADRLGLAPRMDDVAASLPHGDQRRLGIARALALEPAFLFLDEPAAGLNEGESAELVEILAAIRRDFSCALMVIEHDMQVIMRLCDRIQVLDHGRTIAVGTPAEIRSDPAVLTAYLGTSASEVPVA
jgi:ABC-type branched-subunit amino acid transport system ATPase component